MCDESACAVVHGTSGSTRFDELLRLVAAACAVHEACEAGHSSAPVWKPRVSPFTDFVNFVRAAKPLRGFVFFVSFVKRRSRLVVPSWVKKEKGGP